MSNYQKIRKTIVAKIEDGVYRPGEPINSLRELAKSTGSSVGTVGRAITHLVSEGYLYAGKGRRFYVDEKKSRASNKFQTVGLLSTSVPNLQHPGEGSLFQDAIVAVQGGLDQVGMATLIVPASRWFQALGKYEFVDVEELASRGLQGLLVLGIYSLSYLRKLRARIPVLVAMDIDASDEGIDCAAFDNRRSAIEVVKRLADMGAKRIAFVGGPCFPARNGNNGRWHDPCGKERFDGWSIGMSMAGLDPDPKLAHLVETRDSDAMRRAAFALLHDGANPDAVVTEDLSATADALKAADPERAARILLGGWSPFPVSDKTLGSAAGVTAVCDFKELGRKGVEVFMRRLKEPELPVQRELIQSRIEPAHR